MSTAFVPQPCRGGPSLTTNPPFGELVCVNETHLVGIVLFSDGIVPGERTSWGSSLMSVLMLGNAREDSAYPEFFEPHVGSAGHDWPKSWHRYNPERTIYSEEGT